MKKTEKLIKALKKHLEEQRPQIVANVRTLLAEKNFTLVEGYSDEDLRAPSAVYFFEYKYDYLDIFCWVSNEKGEVITKVSKVTLQKNETPNDKKGWKHFKPEAIDKEELTLEDDLFDEDYDDDQIDEILSDYNEQKYALFEDWFMCLFKEATQNLSQVPRAYFSVHDTNFRTDLHTKKTVREEEIFNK